MEDALVLTTITAGIFLYVILTTTPYHGGHFVMLVVWSIHFLYNMRLYGKATSLKER